MSGIVTKDPSYTASILKAANSAFNRSSDNKVDDVNEAIGNIGFQKVKDALLNNAAFKFFKNDKNEQFCLVGLWEHSLGVAETSREIAKFLGKPWFEVAYTCGLMHDIGKVARFKLDELDNTGFFVKDSQFAQEKSLSFFQAEIVNQSPRHDYLGYLLCQHWGMSACLESVVMWHHEPDVSKRDLSSVRGSKEQVHLLIDVIIIANWFVHYFRFGFSGHRSTERPPNSLLKRLEISDSNMNILMKRIEALLAQTKEIAKIKFQKKS